MTDKGVTADGLGPHAETGNERRIYRVDITADQAETRLDRALSDAIVALSRTRIKALIEDGCLSVDGRTIREPAYRVKPGHILELAVPPARPSIPVAQDIPLHIVFEDDQLIVVNKPAGLVVHPAPGSPDATLVNALLAHCGDSLSGIGGVRRPGIVHRLDKDTSGLLVVAKTDAAHAGLAAQFADRTIKRLYHAVVWSVPAPMTGEISGNIGRDPRNRKKMTVRREGGRPALTRYRVLTAFATAAALIECRLETGRTHQIRVHLAARGYPLIGDPTYGRVTAARRAALGTGTDMVVRFPRQALHAATLGFRHPTTGTDLQFESDTPADMRELLSVLDALELTQN
jgi:23S rRNA pseudouridine1911/1915/1917 synthase